MEHVIKLTSLTKTYGNSRGIKNIDLSVEQGTVFGFLGPNGAGKTTTISIMVDLLRATSGSAHIFGNDSKVHGIDIRRRVGYLSGDMALDGSLTGEQQLLYFGALRGVYDKKYVAELAERLDCDLGKKIKKLSRGNKQKIGLISALMHKPELLILDEPTSGLDPLIQEQFNQIVLEHKQAGRTTFISSHILSEVQQLCDHVAFIKEGALLASKPIGSIVRNAPYEVALVCSDKKISSVLSTLPGIRASTTHHALYSFTYVGHIDMLLRAISSYPVTDISIVKGDLESAFMEFYKD